MVQRNDSFFDARPEARPGTGRRGGYKQPDFRHESQEDFGLTRRPPAFARDDDDFLDSFEDTDFLDDEFALGLDPEDEDEDDEFGDLDDEY